MDCINFPPVGEDSASTTRSTKQKRKNRKKRDIKVSNFLNYDEKSSIYHE